VNLFDVYALSATGENVINLHEASAFFIGSSSGPIKIEGLGVEG
jgi:hypothetical protein